MKPPMTARAKGLPLVLAVALALGAVDTGDAAISRFRTIDGHDNNRAHPLMGAAETALVRLAGHMYEDYVSMPSGRDRPNARAVSNLIADQASDGLNQYGASDYVWLWGQFIDHDLGLTEPAEPAEPFDIKVPRGDPFFDLGGTGGVVIAFNRSDWKKGSGTGRLNPRRQMNEITSWIDASGVYGSDEERAEALRGKKGKLKTSRGKLLPRNSRGLPNAGGPRPDLFLAGDIRANENVALTAMHTVWVREHNRTAKALRKRYPDMSADEIYETARARVGALIQVITYNEFLPALLGPGALAPYRTYRSNEDPTIAQEFSTAAFRFGHSMVSPRLLRLDKRGREIRDGHLSLRDAFFNPESLVATGVEPLLRGLAEQRARHVDNMIVDELRNFLFGPPGAGGFDLAALNIQRGRDHGLATYYDARIIFGLKPPRDFEDITSSPQVAAKLEEIYGNVRRVDLWVGGLAETHEPGSNLGPLFHRIVAEQFERLRDADWFWYERMYSGAELDEIRATRLSDVIRRNSKIRGELPDDVFEAR
jgi:peroxidase